MSTPIGLLVGLEMSSARRCPYISLFIISMMGVRHCCLWLADCRVIIPDSLSRDKVVLFTNMYAEDAEAHDRQQGYQSGIDIAASIAVFQHPPHTRTPVANTVASAAQHHTKHRIDRVQNGKARKWAIKVAAKAVEKAREAEKSLPEEEDEHDAGTGGSPVVSG